MDEERPHESSPESRPDGAGPPPAHRVKLDGPSWAAVERLEALLLRGYAMLEAGDWDGGAWRGFRPQGPGVRGFEEQALDFVTAALGADAEPVRSLRTRLEDPTFRDAPGHLRAVVGLVERAVAAVRRELVMRAGGRDLAEVGRTALEAGRVLVHAGAAVAAAAWVTEMLVTAVRRRADAVGLVPPEASDPVGPALDPEVARDLLGRLAAAGHVSPAVAEKASRCLRLAAGCRSQQDPGFAEERVARLVDWTIEVCPRLREGR